MALGCRGTTLAQNVGDFVRISAAEGNRPWAVSSEGVVYRYNGLWWENKDTDVVDVAADTLGNVYIAKVDGALKKWNPLRSEWRQVDGTAYRIALDMTGNPWAVARDGRVRSFDGKDWITLPGRATDIAIGGNNAVVIVDAEGQIRIWDPARRSWRIIAGVNGAKATAAAPDGGPWAVIEGGAIMATTLLVAPKRSKPKKAGHRKAGRPRPLPLSKTPPKPSHPELPQHQYHHQVLCPRPGCRGTVKRPCSGPKHRKRI